MLDFYIKLDEWEGNRDSEYKRKYDISNLEGSVNCSKYWVRDIMGE